MKTETTWIDCGDSRLYAQLYIPSAVPAPAILICHGMNRQGFHLLKIYTQLARTACENGFVALLFDFRGVGRSEGEFDYGLKEQLDVKCALNYLASRPDVIIERIYAVGHSLGGAVSVYALRGEKRVRGLVLWSVPKNHDYNVKKFVKNARGRLGLYEFLFFSRIDKLLSVSKIYRLEVYGIDLRPKYVREKLMKLNEVEAISKLKGIPVLVVNGQKDEIVGIDEAESVYNAANGPKELLIIESTDHIFRKKEDELVRKTMDWIKKREDQSP